MEQQNIYNDINDDICNDCSNNDGTLVVHCVFDDVENSVVNKIKLKLYKLTGVSPQLECVKETDEQGNCIFKGLSFGYYRIIEYVDRKKIKVKYLPWNEFEINKDNLYVVINIRNKIKEIHEIHEKAKENTNTKVNYDFDINKDYKYSNINNFSNVKTGNIIVQAVLGKAAKEPLSGVTIDVYKLVGNDIGLEMSVRTDKNGFASFTDLEFGDYIVTEKINQKVFKSPYYIENQIVSINDDNLETHIIVINMLK